MKNALALCFILLVFLSGCNYHSNKDVPGQMAQQEPSNPGQPTDPEEKIKFQTVYEKVFSKNCTFCHSSSTGNAAGVNLETYPQVIKNISEIRQQVLSGRMPLAGPALTSDQMNLLIQWIDSGAPEN
jgi:uncharacterized membrane protein